MLEEIGHVVSSNRSKRTDITDTWMQLSGCSHGTDNASCREAVDREDGCPASECRRQAVIIPQTMFVIPSAPRSSDCSSSLSIHYRTLSRAMDALYQVTGVMESRKNDFKDLE